MAERQEQSCGSCKWPSYAGHAPECDEVKETVTKKIKAISTENLGLNPDIIRQTAEQETREAEAVWSGLNSKRRYSENRDIFNEWKSEVTSIRSVLEKALQSKDFSTFVELLKTDTFHTNDVAKLIGQIEAAKRVFEQAGIVLDNEAITLLAINAWMIKKQGGDWAGDLTTFSKALRRGTKRFSDLLNKNGAPSCVDTSYTIKAIAHELGFEGQIKQVQEGVIPHRYFETNSGKVMDYWWNRGQGGICPTADIFQRTIHDKALTLKNITTSACAFGSSKNNRAKSA